MYLSCSAGTTAGTTQQKVLLHSAFFAIAAAAAHVRVTLRVEAHPDGKRGRLGAC